MAMLDRRTTENFTLRWIEDKKCRSNLFLREWTNDPQDLSTSVQTKLLAVRLTVKTEKENAPETVRIAWVGNGEGNEKFVKFLFAWRLLIVLFYFAVKAES